jgi:hypothetical protein
VAAAICDQVFLAAFLGGGRLLGDSRIEQPIYIQVQA